MKAPERVDFLLGDPRPVAAHERDATSGPRVLPEALVTKLMAIPGVDGVWVEELGGQPEVVVYVTERGAIGKLPTVVAGLPVRPQVGEPIRTQDVE